jgi:hypothetical protein
MARWVPHGATQQPKRKRREKTVDSDDIPWELGKGSDTKKKKKQVKTKDEHERTLPR